MHSGGSAGHSDPYASPAWPTNINMASGSNAELCWPSEVTWAMDVNSDPDRAFNSMFTSVVSGGSSSHLYQYGPWGSRDINMDSGRGTGHKHLHAIR